MNKQIAAILVLCFGLTLACGRRQTAFAEAPYKVFNVGTFKLLVADTPAKSDHGLMFVNRIPENRGMLFVQGPGTRAMFWMRGCAIPMDMVFIGPDGVVQKVLTAQPTLPETPDQKLPIYTVRGAFQREQMPAEAKILPPSALVVEVAEGFGPQFAAQWNASMLPTVANAGGAETSF